MDAMIMKAQELEFEKDFAGDMADVFLDRLLYSNDESVIRDMNYFQSEHYSCMRRMDDFLDQVFSQSYDSYFKLLDALGRGSKL